MRELIYALGAAGLGAAAMYFMDPTEGNRRRSLVRDKVVRLNRQTKEAVSGRVHDMTNRAKGMLHEAKSSMETKGTAADQPATFS